MNKNPFTTHSEFLKKLLNTVQNNKNLDILELGSGFGSTPILHEYCTLNKIKLKTLDNNSEWLTSMHEKFKPNEFHEYVLVNDWYTQLKKQCNNKYFLVFIDQSPWEARTISLDLFKNISEYVIVHDCDYFPTNNLWGKVIHPIKGFENPGLRDYSDVFKYYKEYFPEEWACETGPPTLIGSQFNEIKL